MGHSCRLAIARTWDGRPTDPEQMASLILTLQSDRLRVEVEAPFHGDPPPPGPPASHERLWDYEVVELFLAARGERHRYSEIELSPHGHYLMLRFEGVRRRIAAGLPLEFQTRVREERWRGTAIIERRYLPAGSWVGNAYRMHGSAPRHYLAAFPVPGKEADFHQPEYFRPLKFDGLGFD